MQRGLFFWRRKRANPLISLCPACSLRHRERKAGRARRHCAALLFRPSENLFAKNPQRARQRKRFSEPSEKAPLGLGSGLLSRPPGVCPERSLRDHKGDQVMQAQAAVQNQFIDTITQGDCIQVMREMPANSVDFILTDPPYLVNYRDRDGRSVPCTEAESRSRDVLRLDKGRCLLRSVEEAGFQPVGHIVLRKTYSSKSRFFSYQHELAYLLAKGRPPLPKQPLADVMDMPYSGNKLHPTQKPIEALAPLVRSFTLPDELVLDPFAGSGSSCAAALLTGRRYVGIELDAEYFHQASARLTRVQERISTSSVAWPRSSLCGSASRPPCPLRRDSAASTSPSSPTSCS